MKTFCPSLKLFFTATAFAAVAFSQGQTVEYLNLNNVNAGIGIGGSAFNMHDYWDTTMQYYLFEVPKGTNKRAIFTSSLWMSGFDMSFGVPHCAFQQYGLNTPQFYDGPIVSAYDSLYDNFYHRVFKITKAQIDYFKTLIPPVSVSQIDSALLKWPGKGNPFVFANYGVFINSPLAPFIDVDGDQTYNPINGDYPAICADEAVFFVFNDDRGYHHETGGDKLGFEIRGLAEIYNDVSSAGFAYEKRALNNNVFVSYEIENKSTENYRDFYLGLWEDPDLGCYDNDRVGCDTNRNLMFVYNGTMPDPSCQGTTGYLNTSVAHGVKMLNQDMSAFGYFTNGAPTPYSDPRTCMQHRNYLQGIWADGTPFRVGPTGYTTTGTVTTFLFPGNPTDTASWSELQSGVYLQPGDRRMFGSIGPMNFMAGEHKHFDFAFYVSLDSTSTMNGIVDTLKRDGDILQAFYDSYIDNCRIQQVTGVREVTGNPINIILYPNPATDELNLGVSAEFLRIYQTDGKLVLEERQTNKVNVSTLAQGVYIAEVKAGEIVRRVRWVKL